MDSYAIFRVNCFKMNSLHLHRWNKQAPEDSFRVDSDIIFIRRQNGLNFVFCVIPSKSEFSHCDNLAGKADASTVSAKI